MSKPMAWKFGTTRTGLYAAYGPVRLLLVSGDNDGCLCSDCCPHRDAVLDWLESLPAPPAELLEALERERVEAEVAEESA